jgi:Cellulase (glycosyl hydrolase family 5)
MSITGHEPLPQKGVLSRHRREIAIFAIVSVAAIAFSYPFLVHQQTPMARPGIVGWGGVALNEVVKTTPNNPSSKVFPGQKATDFEYLVQVLSSRGLNAVRVSWDPSCTSPTGTIGAIYNASQVSSAIRVASYYNFWIILDNHGYDDPFYNPTCWLNFWSGVTNQFKNSYSRIIWEPENEPCYGGSGCNPAYNNTACSNALRCVSYLSREYQAMINQTRKQGDTHSIVVQSVCSYGCSFCHSGSGDCPAAIDSFPNVTDTSSSIFLSLHSYMDYSYYSSKWNDSTAISVADGFYQTVLAATQRYGWPALNTEGGADPLCTTCAPDTVLSGSAGYSKTTFHFIQTLTNLYDSNNPQRINWLWWPAGDWTDTTESPLGALDCSSSPQGWGCLLKSLPT